jgi:hypothetical protein
MRTRVCFDIISKKRKIEIAQPQKPLLIIILSIYAI